MKEKRPVDPKVRANIYAMAALYLAYLYYKVAWPYLTHDPYGPSGTEFLASTVILGGGTVFLAYLAWRMYKAPRPEPPEDEEGEAESDEED